VIPQDRSADPIVSRLWPGRRRLAIGRLQIDPVGFDEALDAIGALVAEGRGGAVFTPNVDHIVLTDSDRRLQEAYSGVSLSLVDGKPVLWAARLLRQPLPAKVSGSDLLEPLVARAASMGWRVYLLGGRPGVADTVRGVFASRHPRLSVVGAEGPRIDMAEDAGSRRELVARVRAARPDLVFVALGNPKQELFIHEAREELRPAVLVAVGAALDFVAGQVPRAPRWMSTAGVEWLYRLAHEPGRLWRRYLLRDPWFIVIVLRTWWARRAGEGARS
jgi:N-acetylglucosaminyldiphosphoundecaprenol N-acetyl-beta-D-mannosaminyltransferase